MRDLKDSFKSHNLLLTSTFIKMKTLESDGLLKLSKFFDFIHVHQMQAETLVKLNVSPSKIITTVEFMVERTLCYYEICNLLLSNNGSSKWEKKWDSNIGASVADHETATGLKKSHTIPSSRSVANQIRNAIRWGLAGAMAYTIDSDDTLGKCGIDEDTFDDFNPAKNIAFNIPNRNNTSFPLLRTINDAIFVAIDELQEETLRN